MSITVDSTSQRYTSGPQPEADIVVIHTTEGMSWPGYSGGGEAPHATIEAIPGKGILVREHIPEDQYAKALMNLPGGVETNRRGCLQYEFKGTCDPASKANMYYWPEADDVVMKAVADYLRPKMQRWGIPFQAPTFQAYSASYGPLGGTNKVRMSGSTWNAYQGIVGHQHVPENVHGDPGAFPMTKLIGFLKGSSSAPAKPPVPATVKAPGLDVDGAFGNATVKATQRWVGVTPDGDWGQASKRALQRKLGVRVDGLIGTTTIRALQYKVGATTADGVWGKNTTMALQRYLNKIL